MIKIWSRRSVGGASPAPSSTPIATPTTASSISYDNTKYGFTFTLPLSWTGYTLVNETWQGLSVETVVVVETGPLISIRHPL